MRGYCVDIDAFLVEGPFLPGSYEPLRLTFCQLAVLHELIVLQYCSGLKYLIIRNDQVYIAVLAHTDVTVGLDGKDRAFDWNGLYGFGFE